MVKGTFEVLIREAYDEEDGREAYSLDKNGINKLHFMDGEPEDNGLGRNFSDISNIGQLIQDAYDAGAAGYELKITREDVAWDDI